LFDFLFAPFTGGGSGDDHGPVAVLGPRRSKRPPLPLASAYARSAASKASAPMAPAAPPVWEVREPLDSSDPVPHEACTSAERGGGWRLLAASVRGKLHAHSALWRDDAFAWEAVAPWTVIAAADGAGSAPLARVAARVACAEGVRALKEALAGRTPDCGAEQARRLREVLAEAARQAQQGVRREAANRGRPERDFYTTCLLVVHAPAPDGDVIGVLQVGDGAVALYADGECTVLGEADHGAYSSETRFLTTPHIEAEFAQRAVVAVSQGLRAVAVMSDGVSDDFFPEKKRLVELFDAAVIRDLADPRGGAVAGVLRGPARDPQEGRALIEWLRYEKRGSSDDRTLVLLYRGEGEVP
jgi:hypothetical protein